MKSKQSSLNVRSTILIFLAGIALSVPLLSFGQITTATMSGTVRDSSDAVIPGADITIHNVGTGISRTVQSDAQGRYVAPDLSVGSYELRVEAAGFQKEVQTGIALTVGQHAVINFTLNPGAVAESVTINGEAPLVQTATSEVGALVSREQIRDLPLNGRDYTQLALLQPGVVQYREQSRQLNRGMGLEFSIAGARQNQVGFRLNGLDISDGAGKTPGSATGHNLGVDAIQEFQVLTNTFSAEYGKAAGGIVNIVHKSGTNSFHGSLFEYLRNSDLDARNFFDGPSVPPFKRNQFGASLGGPVRKDKTFFFVSYEGLRERLATTLIASVFNNDLRSGKFGPISPLVQPYIDAMPIANGKIFPDGTGQNILQASTPSDENYVVAKMDHVLTSSDSISGSYTFDGGKLTAPDTRIGIVTYTTANENRFQYVTLQETHIFSPTTLNNIRAGFNRSHANANRVPLVNIPVNLQFVPGVNFSSVHVSGIDNYSLPFATVLDRELVLNNFQGADTLVLSRGPHSIKFGMEFYRLQFLQTTAGSAYGGSYSFNSIADFLAARPVTFQADDPAADSRPHIRQSMYGFFAQDDIRISPRLSVNTGVRYEFVASPHSIKPNESTLVHLTDPTLTTRATFLQGTSLKNIAPRVGFAWDVFGDQRTAVRGGLGFYFDPITSYYYLPVVEANPPFKLTRTVNNPPFPGGFAGIRSGVLPARFNLTLLDYHLSQPYRIQYNLGIQRQVTSSVGISAYYVGARGIHSTQLYSEENTRQPQGTTADGRLFFDPKTPPLNPNFAILELHTAGGDSYYNALQLAVNKRLAAGFQMQGSYTFSKSIDTGSISGYNTEGLNTVGAQSPFDSASERALSAFDVRNTFSFNTTYDLPFGSQWRGIAKAAAGWQLGGILSLSSGLPFTPVLGFDNANMTTTGSGGNERPDLKAGWSNNPVDPGNVNRYFDATAFSLPPSGTLGNLGRNTMIGPGLAQLDFTAKKRFRITESKLLEFRSELFNLFNHANFRVPVAAQRIVFAKGGALNASAGTLTATTTSSRQIQFSLRFEF